VRRGAEVGLSKSDERLAVWIGYRSGELGEARVADNACGSMGATVAGASAQKRSGPDELAFAAGAVREVAAQPASKSISSAPRRRDVAISGSSG